MSRKHRNRQPPAGKKSMVATVTVPACAEPRAPAPSPKPKLTERTWLERAWRRGSRLLGSLQMAVMLLSIFAAVLAVGTIVESRFNGRVAQELVYRTWWFALLLLLLGVNIFFAAAKKWPWKKHQIGFLITHVGLLTMLTGGIITSVSGTDAQVALVDSESKQVRDSVGGYPNRTREMVLSDDHQISVRRLDKEEKEKVYAINPGSFLWRSDSNLESDLHPLLSLLVWLNDPLPKHWSKKLDNGAELSALNYYPHARQEPFSPADRGGGGFPAVKVQLTSPQAGRFPAFWLALSQQQGEKREWPYMNLGPALAELVGVCPASLLDEFLKPPGPDQLGAKGQLVLHVGGRLHRLNVESHLGQRVELGNTGHSVRVTNHLPRYADEGRSEAERGREASDPVVYFEHIEPSGKSTSYRATSRMMSRGGALDSKGEPAANAGGLQWWYHPPDFRYGRGDKLRGLLQFAQAEDGKLCYRAFHQDAGAFRLEASGLAIEPKSAEEKKSELFSIWKLMKWQFQVVEHLPSAIDRSRLVPENRRPGLNRPDLMAAIRCKLKNKTETQEFLLGQGQTRRVDCGGERFAVTYSVKTEDLGFELKLLRAEQQVDPGTQAPATYTSYVQVIDDGQSSGRLVPEFLRPITNFVGLTRGGIKADGEDYTITMNEPLDWRGFKLYQSNYQPRGVDERDRPVNLSGFTVGRDPGLFLKYLGSSMLALGIACMFYMRAYFFKPRARPAAVTTASENGELAT